MARKRVVEAPSLHSWEDVNDALRQIAEAQIALGEIQSDMQKQILSARPHRLPRATQKGVPRARKGEHSAIRPQSPAVRVLLSAG